MLACSSGPAAQSCWHVCRLRGLSCHKFKQWFYGSDLFLVNDMNLCEWESSHRVSLCVYLWKQRNSENKDPISVITSNNSLVGFSSVCPLCLCVSTLSSGVRSKPQTATIQLLYSAQTYGRKNVRPECMQIHKITFFLFLIKIQKLTISIKARPSTKNKQRRVTVATSCPTVCLSHRRETYTCVFEVHQLLISLSN